MDEDKKHNLCVCRSITQYPKSNEEAYAIFDEDSRIINTSTSVGGIGHKLVEKILELGPGGKVNVSYKPPYNSTCDSQGAVSFLLIELDKEEKKEFEKSIDDKLSDPEIRKLVQGTVTFRS